MKAEFKKVLDQYEIKLIEKLYRNTAHSSIYQNIHFPNFLSRNSVIKYGLLYDSSELLIAYCMIVESYLRKLPFIKTAVIVGGPICEDKEREVFFLGEISKFYKKERYTSLSIQLRYPASSTSDYILNEFSKKMKYSFGEITKNKATLFLSLNKTIEEIYDSFSGSLKTSIKKARNSKVIVSAISSEKDIEEFSMIYEKMCFSRKIHLNHKNEISEQCRFALQNNNGFILKSMIDDKMIGGAIFITHKEKTVYMCGASDPDCKKIPSMHLLLFEAIKEAKSLGNDFFDLGGYTIHCAPNDQAIGINQFKFNFTSNIIYYTKRIIIVFNPVFNFISKQVVKIKS
jgi:lipid II:glycine glycyltransferase (peptidoglycan interpeptide bridge formation enzyme)